ncbi:uncharacterized protein isoform X2 [Takifugu rubripes]|uniref:uncharacterized protein isoform X2 n=1 Tax=Takifugu rubripes TaxID=31033 RepID=UPI001145C569|nr:uncharacterized protein LOC115251244 isoform X2 [Takifugu rubripes]
MNLMYALYTNYDKTVILVGSQGVEEATELFYTPVLIGDQVTLRRMLDSGSTVVVEPSSSRSSPKNIMVGRVITPMWGDRWIPLKVLNPTNEAVTLRSNTKIADVFPCVAEDLAFSQGLCQTQPGLSEGPPALPRQVQDPMRLLKDCGLGDVDIDSCEVSSEWRRKLAELVLSYQDVFSRDKLDCGEVKDFVHRIHLSDDRPFRLPCRRVPPAHYQQLPEVLSDMEMKGIIRGRCPSAPYGPPASAAQTTGQQSFIWSKTRRKEAARWL